MINISKVEATFDKPSAYRLSLNFIVIVVPLLRVSLSLGNVTNCQLIRNFNA